MKLDKTCGKCLNCFKEDTYNTSPSYKCTKGLQVKLDTIGYPTEIVECFKWESRFKIRSQ